MCRFEVFSGLLLVLLLVLFIFNLLLVMVSSSFLWFLLSENLVMLVCSSFGLCFLKLKC